MQNLFIINVEYTQEFSKVQEVLPLHREFLKKGYEAGFLLASGPKNPKTGGVIVGKFSSKDEAINFTKNDPYTLHNVAKHEVIEFEPVLNNALLDNFLGK